MLKIKQTNYIDLDLLTFVSHELKTPLATLKLNIQILQKQHLKKNQIINIMEQEIEWIIHFINNTLDLKKSDHKMPLNLKWHKWDQYIKKTGEYLNTKINLSNTQLNIQKIPLPIEVHIDVFYITQVLVNLVLNAVEHSPKNNKINISYKLIQNNQLKICVANKGYGIDPQNINKIFKPYYQQQKSTNKVIKGSGLGLTIVKKIIEAHNQTIYAENNSKNTETMFIFTLKTR